MKQASYTRPWRSPSFNDESLPRSATPSGDFYLQRKTEKVETYLNKFEDRPSNLDAGAKASQNESSFISHKKINDNSCYDNEYRIRAMEDSLLHSKAETSKRLDFLEGQIQELSRRISGGNTRGVEMKQEDAVRVSGVERRIDAIEKQLSSLSFNLEAFMRKFEGQSPAQPQQQSSSHSNLWERSESTKELRTPETNKVRYGGVPKSTEADVEPPRRAQSRDGGNVRDNLRQNFDAKVRHQPGPSSELERQDRSQRLEERISLEVRVSKNALKSGLKSPDTERRRKSVSWSEECTPQGKGESESGQKQKRQTFNDESDISQLLETEEKEEIHRANKEKERARTTVKERAQPEDRQRAFDVSYQRSENTQKGGDTTYDRYGKFSEVLIEEGIEEVGQRNSKASRGEKEREYLDGKSIGDMEERRRKIDEEIERRISKQIEFKKRNEVAIEGQKKVYEKTAQVDEDFKISPFSTEKSRDKEVVARLVREKQMRSELISKYSDSAYENSRKSKSPIRGKH